jgi:hypothetical protein
MSREGSPHLIGASVPSFFFRPCLLGSKILEVITSKCNTIRKLCYGMEVE